MKKIKLLPVLLALCCAACHAQLAPMPGISTPALPASKVDFDAYEDLTKAVKEYRKNRLLNLRQFLRYAKGSNTIILDTRSTEMYKRKHLKGAIHLNFSDFTQENLQKLVPSFNTRILIYCNNNFDHDPINFVTKTARPFASSPNKKEITLALNIPTFINLYGYGYRNIYELGDFVSVYNPSVLFEGTDVKIGAPVGN